MVLVVDPPSSGGIGDGGGAGGGGGLRTGEAPPPLPDQVQPRPVAQVPIPWQKLSIAELRPAHVVALVIADVLLDDGQ